MQRREFMAGLGSTAAWPLAARAQQGDRVRRIGVLIPGDENDPVAKTVVSAFAQALADLGWTDGRNMRMELRWVDAGGVSPTRHHRDSTPSTAALQRKTRTIPIVASGLLGRLDRPSTPSGIIPSVRGHRDRSGVSHRFWLK